MPPAFPPAGYFELSPKRIRAIHSNVLLFDTTSALLLWEHPYYPTIYIPVTNLITGLTSSSNKLSFRDDPDSKSNGDIYKKVVRKLLEEFKIVEEWRITEIVVSGVEGEEKVIKDVVEFEGGKLDGFVRIPFDAVDLWLEESIPMHVHIRDPYKRIDTLKSTRHITIKIDGTVMADSHSPVLLFETGLPTRYYLPPDSLTWNYIRSSDTVTRCPYKGEASYYSVKFNGKEWKDVVWYYKYPIAESLEVAGLVCFYNEKVEVWVDGVKEEGVVSKFS